jgi:hypothetical protein
MAHQYCTSISAKDSKMIDDEWRLLYDFFSSNNTFFLYSKPNLGGSAVKGDGHGRRKIAKTERSCGNSERFARDDPLLAPNGKTSRS